MRVTLAILCAVLCLAAATSPARGQSSAETLFIEAQKALARGDEAGAEALLMAALAKDRSFVSALWQLSQIYESQGRLDAARDALARGLEIDPRASWAAERLALLDQRLAAAALAEERRRSRIEEGKRAARIERLAGDAKRALDGSGPDRYEASRAALARVLEEDPGNAWAQAELGRLEPPPPPAAPIDTTARIVSAPAVDSVAAAAAPTASAAGDPPPRRPSPVFLVAVSVLLAGAIALLALDLRRRAAPRPHPLQGTASLVPALDVVTLLCGNRSTGVLVITGDGISGEICIEKGEIVHARCEGLAGKEAFLRLVTPAPCRYRFENHLPTVRRTVTEPLSILLLSIRPPEDAAPGPANARAGRRPAGVAH